MFLDFRDALPGSDIEGLSKPLGARAQPPGCAGLQESSPLWLGDELPSSRAGLSRAGWLQKSKLTGSEHGSGSGGVTSRAVSRSSWGL